MPLCTNGIVARSGTEDDDDDVGVHAVWGLGTPNGVAMGFRCRINLLNEMPGPRKHRLVDIQYKDYYLFRDTPFHLSGSQKPLCLVFFFISFLLLHYLRCWQALRKRTTKIVSLGL